MDEYEYRFEALDKIASYLRNARLGGDYIEFGVWEGKTFDYARKVLPDVMPDMHFIAVDSWEGLPDLKAPNVLDGYAGGFSLEQFKDHNQTFVKSHQGIGNVHIWSGEFSQILPTKSGKFAVAWVDCDLYHSTVPVLDFLTDKMATGSVIVFDDWHCFRNLYSRGEQLACAEWLFKNMRIRLNDLWPIGVFGKAFTVEYV